MIGSHIECKYLVISKKTVSSICFSADTYCKADAAFELISSFAWDWLTFICFPVFMSQLVVGAQAVTMKNLFNKLSDENQAYRRTNGQAGTDNR